MGAYVDDSISESGLPFTKDASGPACHGLWACSLGSIFRYITLT